MKTGIKQIKKAIRLCSLWHGGQWSAVYQYASSGVFHLPNLLRYLQEIEQSLHPEYNLYPGELTKKEYQELTYLRDYFTLMAKNDGYNITYHVHPVYGYNIPFVETWPEGTDLSIIESLKYAI